MPLRILLDARHVRDFGFGTYIRNLLRGLAAIQVPHEFQLVTRQSDQHEFDDLPPNFKTVFYERSDLTHLDQIAFSLFARSLKPDLIHIPLNVVPGLLKRPYVVTVHDLANLAFDDHVGWKQELSRIRLRRGLMRAECVVAVSESTRHDVIHLLGIPPERVERIYGGADPRFSEHRPGRAADPETWARERRRVLERYQVHYPFLLYAGTIRPQKNIPRLVEAFSLLRGELRDHPEWGELRLIIIGDEISRFPAVRRAVIQARIESYVRFLGFVPLDTLRFFYEAASAFVFPSLYEGFGLPPLEAMASGTPVVCSNSTSLPEVVGDAAMIVNPDNVFDIARGVREVLLDTALRQDLIRRGADRCGAFRWEDTARQVAAIYERSVASHSPA